MAKAKGGRAKHKDTGQVAFVYLIKNTERGAQDRRQWDRGQHAVSQVVEQLGGRCVFYLTSGGIYDGVSVVSGITPAAAIQLTSEMERWGTVRATVLPGVHILK